MGHLFLPGNIFLWEKDITENKKRRIVFTGGSVMNRNTFFPYVYVFLSSDASRVQLRGAGGNRTSRKLTLRFYSGKLPGLSAV